MTEEANICPHCGAAAAPEAPPPPPPPPPPTEQERFDALLKRAHGKPLHTEFGDVDDEYDLENEGAPGRGLVAQNLCSWARLWQRFDVAVAAAIFPISTDMIEAAAPAEADYIGQPRPQREDMQLGNLVQMLQGGTFTTVAEMAAMTNSSETEVMNAVEDHFFLSLGDMSGVSPTIWTEGI